MKPGQKLKGMLGAIGMPSCDRCDETAQWMDELGPDGCRKSLEKIVDRIQENAGVVAAITDYIPGIVTRWAIRMFVEMAIKKSEGHLYDFLQSDSDGLASASGEARETD